VGRLILKPSRELGLRESRLLPELPQGFGKLSGKVHERKIWRVFCSYVNIKKSRQDEVSTEDLTDMARAAPRPTLEMMKHVGAGCPSLRFSERSR
jgi:hypothetical protein